MSYTPTSWVNGELVSADDMNRIEQGITDASAGGATDPAFAAVIADPVSATRVALDARYVAKGSLTVNVRDYGAVGNGTTDDTTAINSAITAAAAMGPRTRVLFPAVTGNGYLTSSTINVPGAVDLDMRSAVYCTGSGAGLLIGENGAGRHSRALHRVRVVRATQSDWSSETVIGARFMPHYWSEIHMIEAKGFTIGAQFAGDAWGFSYNKVHLGVLLNNQIGVDLDARAGGWCNENLFLGGSFTVSSGLYETIDRIGVRINSSDASYYSNSNVFHKPSFEIKGYGKTFQGTCVVGLYAEIGNKFLDCRHESPSAVSVVTANNSKSILFTLAYNDNNTPTVSETGTFSGSLIRSETTRAADSSKRLVFKADSLHRKACYYNGSTQVNVPGLCFQSNGTGVDAAQGSAGAAIGADYLEVGGARLLGVYVSTRNAKRFALVGDFDAGYGGRWSVRAHDSAGAVVSSALAVRSDAAPLAYGTPFGGAWRVGSDSVRPRFISVAAGVDYIFVGVSGGSAVCRLRSFSIFALDSDAAPATWLPWLDDGINRGTAAPSSGTWEVGRRILNVAPAAGQPQGWTCTAAGTPGTWVAMSNL